MKKITSKKQLQEEKRLLRQKQADLENKIKNNWAELKYSLKPSSLAKEAVDHILHTDESGKDQGFVKSTLAYGATMLAKKLVEKATSRFGKSQSDKE